MNTIVDKENKSKPLQAVGLLSMGTFLEYFDLMLFVHMAVLMNDLFFPKSDPSAEKLYTAFAVCSTYLFRPVGAVIFGYIGDKMGRKYTVVLTTILMAFSCLVMANLPTYSQIGIAAAWIVTACRIMQSLSSMGELVGAELYLTESIDRPLQYLAVTLMTFCANVGSVAALGISALATSSYGNLNWRAAFWFGLVIAGVGTIARTALRETPDFVDAKRKINTVSKDSNISITNHQVFNEKVNKKTVWYLFWIMAYFPLCFYFTYFYIGGMFKDAFHYTPAEVIANNFKVSIFQMFSTLTISVLSYFFYPLKIMRVRLYIFSVFSLLAPILLYKIENAMQLHIFQVFSIIFVCCGIPANSILYSYFPIFKRFMATSVTYAFSRAVIYVVSSFGVIYLAKYLGHYGLWVLMLPMNILFFLGIIHFENLEKAAGRYPVKVASANKEEIDFARRNNI